MAPHWPSDLPQRFVFIVTYGRSGSTLLQNLLNALPGYQIRGENENAALHLAQSWGKLEFSDQLKRRKRSKLVTERSSPWYGLENIEPAPYGTALAEAFTRNILRPDPGVQVCGFKEIRWHLHPDSFWIYMRFLYQCFPNAQFIFNTRNLADVAKSGWWKDRATEDVMEMLQGAEKLYAAYIRKFPERCHALYYDEYVANPDVFRGLFKYLGEPYDPALVRQIMSQRLDHLKSKPPAAP